MTELNRKIQPVVRQVEDFSFPQPELLHLDNGIPVYMLNSGTQDITKIEFAFKAGSWYEEKLLVAKFTNKMLKEGTRSFSSEKIHETIDYYGAHLETSVDKDMAYVTLYALNKYLSQLLPIIEEVIFQPVFPQKELNTRIQNKKQEFLVNLEKVKFIARLKFNEMVFGRNHPYGRFFEADDFEKLFPADLIRFHKNNYNTSGCRVIVAGKIPAELPQLLNDCFGMRQSESPVINHNQFHVEIAAKRQIHIKKENTIQSAIRIGKVMVNKTHPDYPKLKVANTILGGYFGSRLMTNIREDKGYTYGIGSGISSMQHAGLFFVASEVGSEVTGNAIQEIYNEIIRLQQEKVPASELNLVRNYMLGTFQRSLDGPFAQAESFKSIIEYGLNNDFFKNLVETIKHISPDEIRNIMQQYFDTGTLFELKVGK